MSLTKSVIASLPFGNGTTVGVVVRYKASHDHEPRPQDTHVDCVLPSGAPVGYFTDGADHGFVFTLSFYRNERAQYIRITAAQVGRCVSTLLVLDVGKEKARAFEDAWMAMRAKTDGYQLVTNNCASHAARAARAAGLISPSGIKGVETPNNLYRQIVSDNLVPWRSYSGFVEFKATGASRDEMLLPCAVTVDLNVPPGMAAPSYNTGSF